MTRSAAVQHITSTEAADQCLRHTYKVGQKPHHFQKFVTQVHEDTVS